MLLDGSGYLYSARCCCCHSRSIRISRSIVSKLWHKAHILIAKMPPLTYPAVLLFFFSNILTCRGELDPVSSASIYYANEFQTQLECVQDCIWHYQAYDDVVVAIGCGRPWTNGCICQPDLSSSVSSFLSTCVVANCSSATRQVTSALSVYSLYCAGSATFPSTTRDISSSSTSKHCA